MTDETAPAEGAPPADANVSPAPETPVEPTNEPQQSEQGPEPQPTDASGNVIAPPADAPENPDAGNPPSDGSEVEFTGSGEPPESGPADGVEVVDGEVVPESVGETITPPDQPVAAEVVSGDEAPDVLDSGDELPRHRREVDGVE